MKLQLYFSDKNDPNIIIITQNMSKNKKRIESQIDGDVMFDEQDY